MHIIYLVLAQPCTAASHGDSSHCQGAHSVGLAIQHCDTGQSTVGGIAEYYDRIAHHGRACHKEPGVNPHLGSGYKKAPVVITGRAIHSAAVHEDYVCYLDLIAA
jgi:hypothetical protein